MAVRSDRLGTAVHIGGGDAVLIFETPVGETWLVKRICIFAETFAAQARIVFGAPGSSFTTLYRVDLDDNGVDDHDTWWALDAECQLYLYNVDGAGSVWAQAFGAKLVGVA